MRTEVTFCTQKKKRKEKKRSKFSFQRNVKFIFISRLCMYVFTQQFSIKFILIEIERQARNEIGNAEARTMRAKLEKFNGSCKSERIPRTRSRAINKFFGAQRIARIVVTRIDETLFSVPYLRSFQQNRSDGLSTILFTHTWMRASRCPRERNP